VLAGFQNQQWNQDSRLGSRTNPLSIQSVGVSQVLAAPKTRGELPEPGQAQTPTFDLRRVSLDSAAGRSNSARL